MLILVVTIHRRRGLRATRKTIDDTTTKGHRQEAIKTIINQSVTMSVDTWSSARETQITGTIETRRLGRVDTAGTIQMKSLIMNEKNPRKVLQNQKDDE